MGWSFWLVTFTLIVFCIALLTTIPIKFCLMLYMMVLCLEWNKERDVGWGLQMKCRKKKLWKSDRVLITITGKSKRPSLLLLPLLLVTNRFDPASPHTSMLPTLIRLHKAPPMPKFFQEGLTLDHVCIHGTLAHLPSTHSWATSFCCEAKSYPYTDRLCAAPRAWTRETLRNWYSGLELTLSAIATKRAL